MIIARVIGLVVSTMKYNTLSGRKLLIVRQTDLAGDVTGPPLVAVDTVDAGAGDLVLVAQGSAARQTEQTRDRPVDNTIVAIVETLHANGEVTFRHTD
ncbi:MAG: EutN/CcmL family microcompartment protein [Anaerolineae bacterium]